MSGHYCFAHSPISENKLSSSMPIALVVTLLAGVSHERDKPNDRMALFAAFFFVGLSVTFCSELLPFSYSRVITHPERSVVPAS